MLKELPQRAATLHIRRVVVWEENGEVLVIDKEGNQIQDLQGRFQAVGKRIHDLYGGAWHCVSSKGSHYLSSYVALKQARYLSWSPTPGVDGQGRYRLPGRLFGNRLLVVDPQRFGRALLRIGPKPQIGVRPTFDDEWEYPSVEAAMGALKVWNPEDPETPEPEGWDRHAATGRYRLLGRSSLEYVKGEGGLVGQIRDAVISTYGQDRRIVEVAEKELGRQISELPRGTKCFLVTSESLHCEHNPKCLWSDLIYHYGDRSVVIPVNGPSRFVLNAENIRRRLTE